MRRAPCRPRGLWDQRDLQCLSLPGGGSTRLRGSQTHIGPRPRGEVPAKDPAMSFSDDSGQGGEAGGSQPRPLFRAAVGGGSPRALPTPTPEGLLQARRPRSVVGCHCRVVHSPGLGPGPVTL